MDPKNLKILGYVVLGIMLLNMFLYALRKINGIVFWVVIAAGASFVYWGLPRLRES